MRIIIETLEDFLLKVRVHNTMYPNSNWNYIYRNVEETPAKFQAGLASGDNEFYMPVANIRKSSLEREKEAFKNLLLDNESLKDINILIKSNEIEVKTMDETVKILLNFADVLAKGATTPKEMQKLSEAYSKEASQNGQEGFMKFGSDEK